MIFHCPPDQSLPPPPTHILLERFVTNLAVKCSPSYLISHQQLLDSLFVYIGPVGKCIICNFGRRFVNILSESGWLPSSLSPAHNVGSSPVKLTGNAKFQSLVDITNHQHYNTTMTLHSLSHSYNYKTRFILLDVEERSGRLSFHFRFKKLYGVPAFLSKDIPSLFYTGFYWVLIKSALNK